MPLRSIPLMRLLPRHPLRLLTLPRVGPVRNEGAPVTVEVSGMVCGLCAYRAGQALARVRGVRGIRVDLERQSAELWVADGADVDREALQRALDTAVVARPARRALAAAWTLLAYTARLARGFVLHRSPRIGRL